MTIHLRDRETVEHLGEVYTSEGKQCIRFSRRWSLLKDLIEDELTTIFIDSQRQQL